MKFDIGIITLEKKCDLFDLMTRLFPAANVFLQTGVDVRDSSINNLRDANIISDYGYTTLSEGRKSHRELNSKGGVGLFLANKIALLKDVNTPLLLLEDDCMIKDVDLFVNEINVLLNHQTEYDLAVFGAGFNPSLEALFFSYRIRRKCTFLNNDWNYIEGDFTCTHCVLYSPNGRQNIAEHYHDNLSIQIDGWLSLLSKRNKIQLLVQERNHTAIQKHHVSLIQDDFCLMCHFGNGKRANTLFMLFLIILLITCFTTCYFVIDKRYKNHIN